MFEKVMLVDDERDIREPMQAVFEQEGIPIIAVESGKACLKMLERGFRGIVIVDVMMPEMTGWEVIREMRKRHLLKDNTVCIFSSNGKSARIDNSLALPFFQHSFMGCIINTSRFFLSCSIIGG